MTSLTPPRTKNRQKTDLPYTHAIASNLLGRQEAAGWSEDSVSGVSLTVEISTL